MGIEQSISYANSILPGVPAEEDMVDPRWKAIIDVGKYIQDNPEEVWSFVTRWGSYHDEDLQSAIATCLLEHLLEYHFDIIFPRVEFLANKSTTFGHTFLLCHKFGETLTAENSIRFDQLKRKILK